MDSQQLEIHRSNDDESFCYYRLRPHIRLIDTGDVAFIVGDEVYEFSSLDSHAKSCLAKLAEPSGIECYSSPTSHIGKVIGSLCKILSELDLLQKSIEPFLDSNSTGVAAYFETVLSIPRTHEILKSKSVAIIGCGAMGGEVARHLAASGIGHLTLVDDDVVSQDNLNRQYLFSTHNIGEPKVLVARSVLRQIAPNAKIYVRCERVNDIEAIRTLNLRSSDAILCCADTPPNSIALTIAEYARETGSLFGMATVGIFQGSWGPIVKPDMTPSYSSWRPKFTVPQISHQVSPVKASFGPTNSFVAAAFARDIIHVLMGDDAPSLGTRIVYNFKTMEIQKFLMS